MKKLSVLFVLVFIGAVSVGTLSSFNGEGESTVVCAQASAYDYCMSGSAVRVGCIQSTMVQSCFY